MEMKEQSGGTLVFGPKFNQGIEGGLRDGSGVPMLPQQQVYNQLSYADPNYPPSYAQQVPYPPQPVQGYPPVPYPQQQMSPPQGYQPLLPPQGYPTPTYPDQKF